MNNQNLQKGKETQFKSGEQAAKNGRKGGLQLGENNRKRKLLKEYILAEFDKPIEIDGCVITAKEAAAVRLVNMLLDEKTSTRDFIKALEFCRNTIGEKPVERVETIESNPEIIAELEKIMNEPDLE